MRPQVLDATRVSESSNSKLLPGLAWFSGTEATLTGADALASNSKNVVKSLGARGLQCMNRLVRVRSKTNVETNLTTIRVALAMGFL